MIYYYELRLRVPLVDLRVLAWVWAVGALAWHEWHMQRMDHGADAAEWHRRIHGADRWRKSATWAAHTHKGEKA